MKPLWEILKNKWGFEIQGAPISEYFDHNAVTSDSDLDEAIDNKLLDELEQLDKQILDYCREKK